MYISTEKLYGFHQSSHVYFPIIAESKEFELFNKISETQMYGSVYQVSIA